MVTIRRSSPARLMTTGQAPAVKDAEVRWQGTWPAPSSTLMMKTKQMAKITELRETLLTQGLISLSQQADALGLSRSTTWHLLNGNHKSSGLSAAVVRRMLQSRKIPPNAKRIIEDYVQEKLAGAYGHKKSLVRVFLARLGQDDLPTTG